LILTIVRALCISPTQPHQKCIKKPEGKLRLRLGFPMCEFTNTRLTKNGPPARGKKTNSGVFSPLADEEKTLVNGEWRVAIGKWEVPCCVNPFSHSIRGLYYASGEWLVASGMVPRRVNPFIHSIRVPYYGEW